MIEVRSNKRKGGFAPFLFFLALVSAVGCSAASDALKPQQPARVLFVGNSFTYYNNSLHNHYRRLVRAAEIEFDRAPRVRIMTISGGHLPEHAGGIEAMLTSEDWDVVVMQGHSLGPISEDTAGPFQDAARRYAALARDNGVEPVFFMTWAYSGKPEMTQALYAAYSGIGNELDARVVPVGLAFERVTREFPDIALRIADARHPSLAGTYLAACTFFAVLNERSPEGLPYAAGLDAETATILQRAAWETTELYRTRDVR